MQNDHQGDGAPSVIVVRESSRASKLVKCLLVVVLLLMLGPCIVAGLGLGVTLGVGAVSEREPAPVEAEGDQLELDEAGR